MLGFLPIALGTLSEDPKSVFPDLYDQGLRIYLVKTFFDPIGTADYTFS